MIERESAADTRTVTKVFSVSVPVPRAWQAMTDPAELPHWWFPLTDPDATEPDGFDLYGNEIEIDVLDFELHKYFRYAERGGPVARVEEAAELTVTFEEEGSGTRITMTRSGFGNGADWDAVLDNVSRGMDESIADLVLYLETGQGYPRHPSGARGGSGLIGIESDGGLVVHAVLPDSFASRLGIQSGDTVVELGGAAVFGIREQVFFQRVFAAGQETDAVWIHDGALQRGRATLGEWNPLAWSPGTAYQAPTPARS